MAAMPSGSWARRRSTSSSATSTCPTWTGLSFLRHVKANAAHKFTPVIMLTTESQEAKKAEGRAAGARAWITKPFQPSQLVDAVNRLCV